MTTAAVLLAVAAWIGPGPSLVRARARIPVREHRVRPGRGPAHGPDPLAVASCLDVLAVCLGAGMAVATAAAAAAASAPPTLARVLRRAADLLALGADPVVAWTITPAARAGAADAQVEVLLRLARRSAASGAALAEGVAELAGQARHDA
ncbi:type II secretion system F family protein, partial [Mycobacterium sp. E2733]|uniref:type II secretion system F family protein n=1 Tax=Mycobacterium sp. E2733 TaxID=1834138 RepID=UPI0007FEE4D9